MALTTNILDGRKDGQTDRGKTLYLPPPSGSGGIIKGGHESVMQLNVIIMNALTALNVSKN
jgi:hypothetical protein